MNPFRVVTAIPQKAGGFLILTGFFGAALSAAPVPLPDWVKPIESSFPKIAPAVISEVDDIYTFFEANAEYSHRPEVRAQFETHTQRLVVLQEQADLAVIWQYLKATNNRYHNYYTLGSLVNDRNLAAWLLPIVRFRVEWLKKEAQQSISNRKPTKYFEESEVVLEMSDLATYLMHQGEYSDMENFNIIWDAASKLGCLSRETSKSKRLEEQVKAMQEARMESEQHDQPLWQSRAKRLIEKGVLNADALKPRLSTFDQSNRPKPLGPRKPLPGIKPPFQFKPWMVWPMWIFIVLVSAGLLCWVFRKPKGGSKNKMPDE